MPLDYHRGSLGDKAERLSSLKTFLLTGQKKGRVLKEQNTAYNIFDASCYVPSCQLARYFFCAGVRTSIVMPMDFSFNREISESIFSGTL
jgi:hypothetical protein